MRAMPKESLVVSAVVPASTQVIRDAWLDPVAHAAMTGGSATMDRDGTFHAWGGYITARTITDTSALIVQMWRTTEFPQEDGDSRVEIELAAVRGGTRITLTQTGIPTGQATKYAAGWQEHYFGPMTDYFDPVAAKKKPAAKKKATKKKTAKPVAEKKTAKKKAAKPVAKKKSAKAIAKPVAKKNPTKPVAKKKPAKPVAKKKKSATPTAKKKKPAARTRKAAATR